MTQKSFLVQEGLIVTSNTVAAGNTIISNSGVSFPDSTLQTTAAFGVYEIWIPAAAMVGRTTNPAVANTYESTTNKINFPVLDFDGSSNTYAHFNIKMPKAWNVANVIGQFVWLQPNTTTNFGVYWTLAGMAMSSNDASDVAMGTVGAITSTGGTNSSIYVSPNTPNVSIAATPSARDLVAFEVGRIPGNANDTMTVSARLIGVTLFLTTTHPNDA